ncbi:MAG TPA: sugar ABC transporter permease [Terriglobales bacterium]|nr:sugar ABC transporter permease [Terriglobales bacterium]
MPNGSQPERPKLVPARGKRERMWALLERPDVLGYLLMTPAALIIFLFVAYPFAWGVWMSLTNKQIGMPWSQVQFVGLRNYVDLATKDKVFWTTTFNSFVYTGVATIVKFILGIWLALLLNRMVRFQRFVRAAVLLPWIVPTVLSTIAFLWIFDPDFSVINWTLRQFAVWMGWGPVRGPLWLADPLLALASVTFVNIWRGVPFYAIFFLAGLQTINPELYEAAAIDGASAWQRFWYVTLPGIRPIIVVVLVFSVIVTFSDFQVVYVLTRGGPANSTHLFATYAYQVAMMGTRLGLGAAVSLFMFPVLAVLIILQLLYVRREHA